MGSERISRKQVRAVAQQVTARPTWYPLIRSKSFFSALTSTLTFSFSSVLTLTSSLALALIFSFFSTDAHAASVAFTKHNLSVTGPGPVKATTETQICKFCHTPHGAVTAPLWSHALSGASYIVPSAAMAQWTTLKSRPQNPPDGDSRLCLSCHDGTVAIGSIVNLGGATTTITMQGGSALAGGALSPSSTGFIGTDLSGHHPVSIEVNNALINDKLVQCTDGVVSFKVCNPIVPIKLRPTSNLYSGGPHTGLGIQCSTCHDPHDDPIPGSSKFLRLGTIQDASPLCTKCHLSCGTTCP
jgi:hypothetical protein